jgi:hypothetical protein
LTTLSVLTTSLVIVFVLISPVTHRHLSINNISSIDSGDFTGLSSLTTLSVEKIRDIFVVLRSPVAHRSLDSNKISSIENGDFTGLDNLTRLSGIAMLAGIIVLAHVSSVGTCTPTR